MAAPQPARHGHRRSTLIWRRRAHRVAVQGSGRGPAPAHIRKVVLYCHLLNQMRIVPTINRFNFGHSIRLEDLLDLVTGNPFVPPRDEVPSARGILAGLRRNMAECPSVLVPQRENSLLLLPAIAGREVTRSDRPGLQNCIQIGSIPGNADSILTASSARTSSANGRSCLSTGMALIFATGLPAASCTRSNPLTLHQSMPFGSFSSGNLPSKQQVPSVKEVNGQEASYETEIRW